MFDPSKSLKKMLGPNINVPSYKEGKKVNDLDGDGIPNWKDCQPENMFRQDNLSKDDSVYKSKRYEYPHYKEYEIFIPNKTLSYYKKLSTTSLSEWSGNTEDGPYGGGWIKMAISAESRNKFPNLTISDNSIRRERISQNNKGVLFKVKAYFKDRKRTFNEERAMKRNTIRML